MVVTDKARLEIVKYVKQLPHVSLVPPADVVHVSEPIHARNRGALPSHKDGIVHAAVIAGE